jgi:glutathione S-transferase
MNSKKAIMTSENKASDVYTLWGGALSVYTAKVRSYLIKKGIPYREYYPSHPDFGARIVPALGFFVIPVLEAPDGTIVQDTSDIIDYLEARFPEPYFTPATPVQRTIASLLCAFGSEGLNQPSMHYRWSFLDQHSDYIRTEFGRASSLSRDRAVRTATAEPSIAFMKSYLPALGIYAETIPAIEESYLALLGILDEHFLHRPYLLGGRPSMADFGFMAGLYAHLSRDPVPSDLMKHRAPNVYRWTERMNLANIFDGEFPDCGDAYPADDAIPETLEPLLAHIFQDWGAELKAAAVHYNAWIAENPEMPVGHLVSQSDDRKVHPSLGPITYELRGRPMTRSCAPHSLWHFDKAVSLARGLNSDAGIRLNALVARAGGADVMALTLDRSMKRDNNVLVLA